MSTNPITYKEKIEGLEQQVDELCEKQLRDIQKATVDHLYNQMYIKGRQKMLVADEVGLGKTWVAKGLIAKAFLKWFTESSPEEIEKGFNVYYICSNQQLAAQNLKQLNFTKKKECIAKNVNRISFLAIEPDGLKQDFHIFALTPETSFNPRSSQGVYQERYILYKILQKQFSSYNKKLKDLLKGSYNVEWKDDVKAFDKRIRNKVADVFLKKIKTIKCRKKDFEASFQYCNLSGETTLQNLVQCILERYNRNKILKNETKKLYDEIIGHLRMVLIDSCLDELNANIYIMDEFQRYSELLDQSESHAELDEKASIAQKVFHPNDKNLKTKVLMLSATPFKAYTTRHDEMMGEQHFAEFNRVLKFLFEDDEYDMEQLDEMRNRIHALMMLIKNTKENERKELIEKISLLKREIEDIYTKVMVRTEKIIASNDPNAMTKITDSDHISITKDDVKNFTELDEVFLEQYHLSGQKAPAPLDYAKSAPYPLSFLREYKIGARLINNNIKVSAKAFINLNQMKDYKFPENGKWPNSKFNKLIEGMKDTSKLLWCPPSLEYYQPSGAYKGQEMFTKSLIFSAWKLVPVMIATLMSYEAEKCTIGRLSDKKRLTSRKSYRLLVFNERNKSTMLLAYPSLTLINLINPKEWIREEISSEKILDLTYKANSFIAWEGRKRNNKETSTTVWNYILWQDSRLKTDWRFIKGMKEKSKNRQRDLQITSIYNELRELCQNSENDVNLETVNKKTAMRILRLSLGSPAICAFRAITSIINSKEIKEEKILSGAYLIGLAFIDMFNKPESIAAINVQYQSQEDYWEKVIRYCIDGNIQAMLDEYLFMLSSTYQVDSAPNPIEEFDKMIQSICETIRMRTSTLKVDDAKSILKAENDNSRKSLRSHYAAAFGINMKNTEGSENRATNIREAFNSPFRPFVLATTSIGQEGLDFHWYCRRIVHWNLPNNPIDFEQREGRINRFRGQVIRKRIADEYSNDSVLLKDISESLENPWNILFTKAESTRFTSKFPCEIVPNWLFNPNVDKSQAACIERVVPLYKYSQDIRRYEEMEAVLGLYRLTFGQPRQEELIKAMNCDLSDEEKEKMLINLCPLKRIRSKK